MCKGLLLKVEIEPNTRCDLLHEMNMIGRLTFVALIALSHSVKVFLLSFENNDELHAV